MDLNYAPNIMDLLCHRERVADVLLVAGAPALMREGGALQPFTQDRLTTDDVLETLTSLLARIRVGQKSLEREGTFSFGIPQRGRFRVSYVTQRGSYAMAISPIPMSTPDLEEILEASTAVRVADAIMAVRSGLLVIASSQLDLANRLAYAMISHLNRHAERVVLTLEPHLTFLLKHQRGVVIQCELGTDVSSMEQWVQGALLIRAEVLYARAVNRADDFAHLLHAAKNNMATLVTMARSDVPSLIPGYQLPLEPSLQLGLWRVEPGAAGMLQVAIEGLSEGQEHSPHGQD
jgi:Tfp pilus assembly ATPase PilU